VDSVTVSAEWRARWFGALGLVFTSNRASIRLHICAGRRTRGGQIAFGVKPTACVDPCAAFSRRTSATLDCRIRTPVESVRSNSGTANRRISGPLVHAMGQSMIRRAKCSTSKHVAGQALSSRPTSRNEISRSYDVPARGPHGLDLVQERADCCALATPAVLLAIMSPVQDARWGCSLRRARPDVIFPPSSILVAPALRGGGDPGVHRLIDVDTMRREETNRDGAGAHTLALDASAGSLRVLPRSHRAPYLSMRFDRHRVQRLRHIKEIQRWNSRCLSGLHASVPSEDNRTESSSARPAQLAMSFPIWEPSSVSRRARVRMSLITALGLEGFVKDGRVGRGQRAVIAPSSIGWAVRKCAPA